MKYSPEVVRGIPQNIIKIPLQYYERSGVDLSVSKLIKRVIVGPSSAPYEIAQALVMCMQEAGITDAQERISVPHIPLRT